MKDKVVLAYSGGLDTSVMVRWIQEKYDLDVITVIVDVGQKKDFEIVRERAESLGVLKHYSIDAKQEFVTEYIFPAVKANALYEGRYPVSSALSRPLIAAKLVEVAEREGATAVAHGSSGKGNDQVRFDVTIKSLAPDLKIIAPVREWNLSRDEEIAYAKANEISVPVDVDKPYSVDENLWGRSIECGVLEHPDREPPEDIFEWTVSPEKAPDKPKYVTIHFRNGVPSAINGEETDPVALIKKLNKIVGEQGVGRIDHIEDRLVGIKSREIYECPASTIIIEAHKDLEKLVLTRHEVLFKQQLDAQWTLLVYTGLWMEPLKEDIEAFVDKTQERVNGKVKLKLYKGGFQIVGRSSPDSLYDLNLATYDVDSTFDQSLAPGFIELWGLQTKTANILREKMKEKKRK